MRGRTDQLVVDEAVRAAGGRVEAFAEIDEKIRAATAELIDRTRHGTLTPRAAAIAMAQERLGKAIALRRKF